MSVNYISWHDHYSVGDSRLDAQHQKMFDFINALYGIVNVQDRAPNTMKILLDLRQYGMDHFKTEEAILSSHGYADYDSHKREHEAYLRTIEQFQKRNAMKNGNLIPDILMFLKEWWQRHLIATDQKYVAFLRNARLNTYAKNGSTINDAGNNNAKSTKRPKWASYNGKCFHSRSKKRKITGQTNQTRKKSSWTRMDRQARFKCRFDVASNDKRNADLLGVPMTDITIEAVKRAYHEKVKTRHPDVVANRDPGSRAQAEREMIDINAAYDFFKTKLAPR